MAQFLNLSVLLHSCYGRSSSHQTKPNAWRSARSIESRLSAMMTLVSHFQAKGMDSTELTAASSVKETPSWTCLAQAGNL